MKTLPTNLIAFAFLTTALAAPARAKDNEGGGPSGGSACKRCEESLNWATNTVDADCRAMLAGIPAGYRGCIVRTASISGSQWCEFSNPGSCTLGGTGGGGGGYIA